MHCCNSECNVKAKITLQSANDDLLTAEVTGKPHCEAEDVLMVSHHASTAAKKAVSEALKKGEGPTEVFENVAESTNDIFLTKAAVRTQAVRERRRTLIPDSWPRDAIQCLLMLKQVQKDEISPDEVVPGYLQVSCIFSHEICLFSTLFLVYIACVIACLIPQNLTMNWTT